MEKPSQKGACPSLALALKGDTHIPIGSRLCARHLRGPFSHPPASCVCPRGSEQRLERSGRRLCQTVSPRVNSLLRRTDRPGFHRLCCASLRESLSLRHMLQGVRIQVRGKKRKSNSNQAGILVWPLLLLKL